MQKIRITMLYGMIAAAAAVMFFCAFIQVNAGYITGNEVKFTHTHIDACYTEVTLNCTDRHTSQSVMESGTYHCTTCGIMTDHWIQYKLWTCPQQEVSWQRDARIYCKTCSTEHSHWNNDMPGVHTYKEKRQTCGIQEGTTTATLSISADDAWTNSGVTLTAKINALKQDLIYGNISCSWAGGTLYVTENGTYSATATDAKGRSITASINIGCIDKNPPVIKSVDADIDGMTRTSIYVNVSAEDGESGLDAQAYSFDGGQTWSASSGILLEEGKDVQLAVRDKAGNITTRSLKRGAFPYPPEPSPSPTPTPSPSPSPSPSSSSAPSSSPSSSRSESSSSSSASSAPSSGSAGNSEKTSTDLSNNSVVSGASADLTAEKSDSESGVSASKKGKEGASLDDSDNSNSRKNRLTTEAEKSESDTSDTFDEDENSSDTALSMQIDWESLSGAMEAGDQKQEAVLESLEDNILKTKAAAVPSKGNAPNGENIEMVSGEPEIWLSNVASYIRTHLQSLLGTGLIIAAALLLLRLVWLHSAILYCYNGGEEYKRVALLHLKRKKQEFELYLPEYLLETRGTPRYRLMFKEKLVKRHGGADLVVHGEDYKLRQPLEECVDFVL